MWTKLIIPFCFLLVTIPMFSYSAKPKAKKAKLKAAAKQPSLSYLLARITKAEKAAKAAKQQAFQAKKYIRNISRKMELLSKVDAVKGKFSDEKPCPNKIQGFFYSPQFKSCYYLAPSMMMLNWTDAEKLCQRRHPKAHLVSVDTASKQQYLRTKWQNERGVGNIIRYWTSGQMKNGTWTWTAIKKPLRYHNWIPVTAHNNPGFACLSVLSFEGFFWGDVRCFTRHMVTCEIVF